MAANVLISISQNGYNLGNKTKRNKIIWERKQNKTNKQKYTFRKKPFSMKFSN